MEIIKPDYLDDLEETMMFLNGYLQEGNQIKKLIFRENESFNKEFSSIEEALDYYRKSDYVQVEKITMIVSKNHELSTIQIDKKKNLIAIATSSDKSEITQMFQETDRSMIQEDGCTYYEFEFGQIGKFDPKTSCYYLWKDGKWENSGAVMRWVIDPAYDYKIIQDSTKGKEK